MVFNQITVIIAISLKTINQAKDFMVLRDVTFERSRTFQVLLQQSLRNYINQAKQTYFQSYDGLHLPQVQRIREQSSLPLISFTFVICFSSDSPSSPFTSEVNQFADLQSLLCTSCTADDSVPLPWLEFLIISNADQTSTFSETVRSLFSFLFILYIQTKISSHGLITEGSPLSYHNSFKVVPNPSKALGTAPFKFFGSSKDSFTAVSIIIKSVQKYTVNMISCVKYTIDCAHSFFEAIIKQTKEARMSMNKHTADIILQTLQGSSAGSYRSIIIYLKVLGISSREDLQFNYCGPLKLLSGLAL